MTDAVYAPSLALIQHWHRHAGCDPRRLTPNEIQFARWAAAWGYSQGQQTDRNAPTFQWQPNAS